MTKKEVEVIGNVGNVLRMIEGHRKQPGSCFRRAIEILTKYEKKMDKALRAVEAESSR